MFVVLVGPKGSGKSHIGRTLERALGVLFFHVEPLWMSYYAECTAAGRQPTIEEGIAKVRPRIAEVIRNHPHVCVETTGASPEILNDLLSLCPPSQTLVVKVWAPLSLCLERIATRDPTHQIPMDSEGIRKVYELSSTAVYTPTFTVENTGLSDADIVSSFKSALTVQQSEANPLRPAI
jgi:shikimate kinase